METKTDIRFKGFVPDDEQRNELLTELESIKRHVPKNSVVIAMLDFDGSAFGCSFDIFLENGSAYSFAEGSDLHAAIQRSSKKLEEKLRRFQLNKK